MPLPYDLPQELWLQIIKYFIEDAEIPYQQLPALELTCKSFDVLIHSSTIWHTAYTLTFGQTRKASEHNVDWKSKCKRDIQFLSSIELQVNKLWRGSADSLRECSETMKELWKLVRSSNSKTISTLRRIGIDQTLAARLAILVDPLPFQVASYFHDPLIIQPYLGTILDHFYMILSIIITFDNIPQCPFHPQQICLAYINDSGDNDYVYIPNKEFSGGWTAIANPWDLAGYAMETVSMEMMLQFEPSSEEKCRMVFSGSGSDSAGHFDIVDGIWDTENNVSFLMRPGDQYAVELEYVGQITHADMCGVFSIRSTSGYIGTFWISRDVCELVEVGVTARRL